MLSACLKQKIVDISKPAFLPIARVISDLISEGEKPVFVREVKKRTEKLTIDYVWLSYFESNERAYEIGLAAAGL